jgi:hypothetical protein
MQNVIDLQNRETAQSFFNTLKELSNSDPAKLYDYLSGLSFDFGKSNTTAKRQIMDSILAGSERAASIQDFIRQRKELALVGADITFLESLVFADIPEQKSRNPFKRKKKPAVHDVIDFISEPTYDRVRWSKVKTSEVDFGDLTTDSNGYSLFVWDDRTPVAEIDAHRHIDGGTYITYLGFLDPDTKERLHPLHAGDAIQEMKKRYPRLGLQLLRWVRENLDGPYYAAFANKDLRRVVKAEPTGVVLPHSLTGMGDVPVDRIRVSNADELDPLGWGDKGSGPLGETIRAQTDDWFDRGEEEQKQAIANSLRAAILSPMKLLRHNAIQYQDIMGIPYYETDPQVYLDRINEVRDAWNSDHEILKQREKGLQFGQTEFPEPARPELAHMTAKERYAGLIYKQLSYIARISENIDFLHNAAVQDYESGGFGQIWRDALRQVRVPGANDKVASFSWLLLAPETSDLATIDIHMIRTLGISPPRNEREYKEAEERLRDIKNQMGYEDMPLGAFQWGLWDYVRSGAGTHQLHAPLKPLNPTPYYEENWLESKPGGSGHLPPIWEKIVGPKEESPIRKNPAGQMGLLSKKAEVTYVEMNNNIVNDLYSIRSSVTIGDFDDALREFYEMYEIMQYNLDKKLFDKNLEFLADLEEAIISRDTNEIGSVIGSLLYIFEGETSLYDTKERNKIARGEQTIEDLLDNVKNSPSVEWLARGTVPGTYTYDPRTDKYVLGTAGDGHGNVMFAYDTKNDIKPTSYWGGGDRYFQAMEGNGIVQPRGTLHWWDNGCVDVIYYPSALPRDNQEYEDRAYKFSALLETLGFDSAVKQFNPRNKKDMVGSNDFREDLPPRSGTIDRQIREVSEDMDFEPIPEEEYGMMMQDDLMRRVRRKTLNSPITVVGKLAWKI